MSVACICCGSESTLLCDFVLGFELGQTLPYPTIRGLDGQVFTCDAPLCRTCAEFQSNCFFHGAPEVTGVETIDYCPLHAKDTRHEGNPIMPADADYLRRQAWAQLRRIAMRAPAHD